MNKNDKAGIREVRDLIDKLDDEKITPMQNDITTIIEKLANFIGIANDRHDYYLKKFDANNEKHEEIEDKAGDKISIKAFATWLSITTVVISSVLTIAFKFLFR